MWPGLCGILKLFDLTRSHYQHVLINAEVLFIISFNNLAISSNFAFKTYSPLRLVLHPVSEHLFTAGPTASFNFYHLIVELEKELYSESRTPIKAKYMFWCCMYAYDIQGISVTVNELRFRGLLWHKLLNIGHLFRDRCRAIMRLSATVIEIIGYLLPFWSNFFLRTLSTFPWISKIQ